MTVDRRPAPREAEPVTCEELIHFLDAYLAGELSRRREVEFRRHLSVCPSCVAYLETYRATIRLAKESSSTTASEAAELPRALVQAILAARG
jgi:anti-sigma factor RsiW